MSSTHHNIIDIDYLKRIPRYSNIGYAENATFIAYYKKCGSKTALYYYNFNLHKEFFVYSEPDLRAEFPLKFLRAKALVFSKSIKPGALEGNIFKVHLRTGQLVQLTYFHEHIVIPCETSHDGFQFT